MIKRSSILFQPQWEQRHSFYELATQYGGVEIVSFAFPSVLNFPADFNERLSAYKEELPGLSCKKALHGAFIDVIPHSPDKKIADIASARVYESLDVASSLGCSHVVFHSGINPLIRHPDFHARIVETQGTFWQTILREYPSLTICIENMWEPNTEMLKKLVMRVANPRFGICWDCGHSNIFSNCSAAQWIQGLSEIMLYSHWNDNLGDLDSELSLGDGNINWVDIVKLTSQLNKQPLVVLEVGSLESVKRSLDYLEKHKLMV